MHTDGAEFVQGARVTQAEEGLPPRRRLSALALAIIRLAAEGDDGERAGAVQAGEDAERAHPLLRALEDVASECRPHERANEEGRAPDVDHARPVAVVEHVVDDGEADDLRDGAEEALQRAEGGEGLEGARVDAADDHAHGDDLRPEPRGETGTCQLGDLGRRTERRTGRRLR